MRRCLSRGFTALFLFLSFSMEPTVASVILRMAFDQVVKGAELIVDGEVVSKETRLSPISGRPFTYFNIAIIDLIKGDYPKKIIEIGYMGGQIGDMALNVSNMRMPGIGERGIYFIETTHQQQVHPLIGWQQGHYRVIIDPNSGQERVVSEYGNDRPERSRALSLPQGVGLNDFKQEIRGIVEGGN